jgi:glycosyltransferase involved in cell wall biosynthesis
MNAAPRLSIGLPVYDGENYLAESLDALLGQSYEDFELIISDNASTDGTADIRRRYQKQDLRIRHIRQPRNFGLAPNHNFVFEQARGELFKRAPHNDLHAHPAARLYAEHTCGYIAGIRRAPLQPADRRECYRYLVHRVTSRALPRRARQAEKPASPTQPVISVDTVVPGRGRSPS